MAPLPPQPHQHMNHPVHAHPPHRAPQAPHPPDTFSSKLKAQLMRGEQERPAAPNSTPHLHPTDSEPSAPRSTPQLQHDRDPYASSGPYHSGPQSHQPQYPYPLNHSPRDLQSSSFQRPGSATQQSLLSSYHPRDDGDPYSTGVQPQLVRTQSQSQNPEH